MKNKRAVAKEKFTQKFNAFLAAQNDAAPAIVLNGIYEEVDLAFRNGERLNEGYLELLYKSAGEGKSTQGADEFMSQLEASKLKVKVDLEVAKQTQSQANGVSVELVILL